ncbi:hypothetical protein AHAS_Ahas08G0054100 [Arachis hypogaea]
MPELKLVRFHAPDFRRKLCAPEDITSLPKKLSYFHWDEFPLKSLPSSFGVERIVEIIMPDSGFKRFGKVNRYGKRQHCSSFVIPTRL